MGHPFYFSDWREIQAEVSAQSSPKSSAGCGVRMVPLPQRRSLAGQYLSHPQQMRSGFLGRSAILGPGRDGLHGLASARSAAEAAWSRSSRIAGMQISLRMQRMMSVTWVTELAACYQRNAGHGQLFRRSDISGRRKNAAARSFMRDGLLEPLANFGQGSAG